VAYARISRPRSQIEFAGRILQETFDAKLFAGPRVDLYALATARNVRKVRLEPLLVDGRLLVMQNGFVVQLNDTKKLAVDLSAENPPELNRKQRFTLAHEIAHTLVYDVSQSPPQELSRVLIGINEAGYLDDRDKNVEEFCQIAAGLMLVPGRSLKNEIKKLGRDRVDGVSIALRLADSFQVSPEALIHRLTHAGDDAGIKAEGYALLILNHLAENPQVRACLFSTDLIRALTRPKLYKGITNWLRVNRLPKDILTADGQSEWRITRSSGTLNIRRMKYSSDSWFLEIILV
jgi:Zn-dependent peptidase ImmA (M78 family)